MFNAVVGFHRDGELPHQYGVVISVGHYDDEQIVSVHRGVGASLPLDEMEALWRFRRKKALAAKRAEKEAGRGD